METFLKCFLFLLLTFGFLGSINGQSNADIKVAAVVDHPYLMKDPDGKFIGIVPDLLNKLQYNYTIYFPSDHRYGSQYDNGTWSGMIGELVKGSADVAGLFTVTSRRSEVVDTSFPVMSVSLSIVMRKPNKIKPSLQESLQDHFSKLFFPFELSVWLMSFVALFVTSTVLYIIMHFNPYEWRRMARDHEATIREGESFTCLNAFFFVASTLMWQGYVRAPRSISARVLVVAWWAFTIIFIVSYTASLTNYLGQGPFPIDIPKYTNIRSVSDLANSNDVRVGFLPGGSTERFLQESKSTVYQDIYRTGIEDPNFVSFKSVTELIKLVRTTMEQFAIILESSTAKYMVNRKPCDLYAIDGGFPMRHYVFGFQKNSTLKAEFNMALMRLSETGELHEIEQKWFQSKDCSDVMLPSHEHRKIEIPKVYRRLDLSTFSAALLIVVAGIIIGGIICIIEICIFRKAEANASEEDEALQIPTDSQTNEKLLKPDEKIGGTT